MRTLSRIVLASASPRRLALLRSLGLTVEVTVSGYEGRSQVPLTPTELASYHAGEKLAAVTGRQGAAFDVPVVAADTVVDLDGIALGKPRDAAEAVSMLARLSGREHVVHTAFALAVPGVAARTLERTTTVVRFYPLEPDEIAEYVATGEPFDNAGAYGIQGRAASLVRVDRRRLLYRRGLAVGRFDSGAAAVGICASGNESSAAEDRNRRSEHLTWSYHFYVLPVEPQTLCADPGVMPSVVLALLQLARSASGIGQPDRDGRQFDLRIGTNGRFRDRRGAVARSPAT